jgi:hypothetical protein
MAIHIMLSQIMNAIDPGLGSDGVAKWAIAQQTAIFFQLDKAMGTINNRTLNQQTHDTLKITGTE